MVFENIKSVLTKRKENKQSKRNFYLVKTFKSNICHVVDQKLLEVMLMEGSSLESVSSSGYTKSLGWFIGEDEKVYEKHELNFAGKDYHRRFSEQYQKNGERYIAALNEMNDGKETKKFLRERNDINFGFSINLIKSITKFEGQEKKYSVEKKEEVKTL